MHGNIGIAGVWRANLRVTSLKTAVEFLDGVRSVIIIRDRHAPDYVWRFEPGGHISRFPVYQMAQAPFIPALQDQDGRLAYQARASINGYLAQ